MVWRAFLFDVDGTLAETERDAHRVAFNYAFQEHGLDWHWDESLYGDLLAITGGKERMRFYIDQYLPEQSSATHWQTLIPTLHKTKTDYYVSLLDAGRVPLRPGVKRLLSEALQEGVRLAIVTTTTPDNVIALLENSLGKHAVEWFEVIAAGDRVKAKKPASDIYLWTLSQMSLKPNECLAIEDSENGLRAAHGAGIPTLITINDYTKQQNFQGAIKIINHLGEKNNPTYFWQDNTWQPMSLVDVAYLQSLKKELGL